MNRNLKKGLILTASVMAGMLCSLALKKDEEKQPVTKNQAGIPGKEDAYNTICTPEQRKRQYAKDLQKYGTRQGVIDISDCRNKKRLGQIELAGAQMLATFNDQRNLKKKAYNLRDDIRATQLTLTNITDRQQEVTLWGQGDNPGLEGVEATTPTGIHPQDIVFNAANNLAYVANQLSDSISILSARGKRIDTIVLGAAYPGMVSPVALAVNDNPATPDYGKVYVAGSVSDTISVITTDNVLDDSITLDAQRPVAIAFNRANNNLYVACLVSRKVLVIDGNTHQVIRSLESGEPPVGLGVNPDNGDVFVAYSESTRLGVYNKDHSRVATVEGIPEDTSHLVFDAAEGCIWAASGTSPNLVGIDATSYQIRSTKDVGSHILAMAYNPANEKLSLTDGTSLKTLQDDGSFSQESERLQAVNALAFDTTGALLTTAQDLGNATVSNKASVTIDADYAEKNRHFRYAPAVIEQVRFIMEAHQRIPLLTARNRTVSGKEEAFTFSLEKYRSTRHFQNIITMPMKGFSLNGHSSWQFHLQPGQTVTLLVSYRQLDSYALIPPLPG
ncbi:YncE family protein [Fulvivirga sp. 29W222]|uniref:YncE family protein n=1 Tax=Fulvivirga marina TaxID=2494733 RepID=A0A937KAN6_9BACT|nr:YncE family protein [Fulvivirga marina]MBL6444679.1 YncE family protein [Fulvivirga marina]